MTNLPSGAASERESKRYPKAPSVRSRDLRIRSLSCGWSRFIRNLWTSLLVLPVLLGPGPVDSAPARDSGFESVVPLPQGDLFNPLLADPKQPRFSMSILHVSLPELRTTAGVVSFGENFGLIRWGPIRGGDLQLNMSGAVFAQFDLEAPSSDLINADYVVGFPLTWSRDRWSARFRIYHQSSHLGDEFLIRAAPERVNLSFESLEALASFRWTLWRTYIGGEYLFHRDPRQLKPGLIHGGLEYRQPNPIFRVGEIGVARWVSAVDVKSWQEDDWAPAWSVKSGVEFSSVRGGENPERRLSLLAQWYHGFAPYGQFFNDHVSYFGLGIDLSL